MSSNDADPTESISKELERLQASPEQNKELSGYGYISMDGEDRMSAFAAVEYAKVMTPIHRRMFECALESGLIGQTT